MPDAQDPEAPPFDATRAASYVGRTILVGLTYCDARGREIRHEQLHGTVQSASRAGVVIALAGERAGERWNLPPDLDAIAPADPGEYRLRASGEVVRDPDLLATWTIHTPPARGAADVALRLVRGPALLGMLAALAVLSTGVWYVSGLPFPLVVLLVLGSVLVNGLVAVIEDDLPGGFHNPDGRDTPRWLAIAVRMVRWASVLALLAFAVALLGLAALASPSPPFVLGMALACAAFAAALLVRRQRRALVWLGILCALGGTALTAVLG